MLTYKRTSWGYVVLKRDGTQVGAGVGLDAPYGHTMSKMWRRIWNKRGIFCA